MVFVTCILFMIYHCFLGFQSIVSELYVMVVFFIEQGRENARLARLILG